jgi:hypothetical protein
MTKKKNTTLQDADDGWGGYDWMQAFFGGVSRMTVYRWWKSGVISQPQYPTGSINKPFWWKRTVREQATATAAATAATAIEIASARGKRTYAMRRDRRVAKAKAKFPTATKKPAPRKPAQKHAAVENTEELTF